MSAPSLPPWASRALSCDRTLCIWAQILDQPQVDRGAKDMGQASQNQAIKNLQDHRFSTAHIRVSIKKSQAIHWDQTHWELEPGPKGPKENQGRGGIFFDPTRARRFWMTSVALESEKPMSGSIDDRRRGVKCTQQKQWCYIMLYRNFPEVSSSSLATQPDCIYFLLGESRKTDLLPLSSSDPRVSGRCLLQQCHSVWPLHPCFTRCQGRTSRGATRVDGMWEVDAPSMGSHNNRWATHNVKPNQQPNKTDYKALLVASSSPQC